MQQRFENTRNISSPSSHAQSFSQSTVTQKNFQQSRQQPQKSTTDLKYSQASYATSIPKQFYTSQINQFQPTAQSTSNLFTSNVSDSTTRQFYKGLGSLPEDRIRLITQSFIKIYGSGGQIRKHEVEKIQQIAHSNDSTRFQQDTDTVAQLFEVMDQNTRDKRINQDDIYVLCRRYLNCQKKPIVYTPMVQERLSVARRLFKQFDVEKKSYLTEKQVPNLLRQTYKTLGRDFQATEDDIRSWMKLTDRDGDGHVTLVEYERSIIRALKKQGIKIYED